MGFESLLDIAKFKSRHDLEKSLRLKLLRIIRRTVSLHHSYSPYFQCVMTHRVHANACRWPPYVIAQIKGSELLCPLSMTENMATHAIVDGKEKKSSQAMKTDKMYWAGSDEVCISTPRSRIAGSVVSTSLPRIASARASSWWQLTR